MALTRKMLKGMGLTEEQVDTIVEAHTETVDGLKDQLKTAKEKADQLDAVQRELDGLKAKGGDDWKSKYEAEKQAFADYKADVTAKEAQAAKETAASAYFEGKKITGKNLAIAMRAARDEIKALELDADGKPKDTATLDALVGGELASLVVKTSERGANPANPPKNEGGAPKTRADVYAKDDKGRFVMDASARQKALSEIIANEQKGK